MTRRRVLPWILTGFLSSAAFQACGASSTNRDDGNGSGLAGSGGNPQGDGMVVDAPPGSGAGGESPYDPLCGVTDDSCIPDLAEGDRSCMPVTAGAPASTGGSGSGRAGAGGTATGGSGGTLAESGAGGEGGQSGQGEAGHGGMGGAATGEGGRSEAGATGESGGTVNGGGEAGAVEASGGESIGGQPSTASGGEPSVSGDAGAPAGVSGESGGSGGGTVTVSRSCQVELADGEPRASCAPSGRGMTGAGCFSSADCAAGLACVGRAPPGQCRPYCCTGDSACNGGGTHCDAEQHLVGTTGAPRVPVCMPATGCNLADEYPCPDAGSCSCQQGKACMVVTDDGKTSCIPESSLPGEGEGQAGQACPCAWGHVCSKTTNRCARLCQPAAPGDVCGGARCQFAGGLPPLWGICTTDAEADAG